MALCARKENTKIEWMNEWIMTVLKFIQIFILINSCTKWCSYTVGICFDFPVEFSTILKHIFYPFNRLNAFKNTHPAYKQSLKVFSQPTKMRFAPSHPSFDAIQFHLFNSQFMNIHFYREFIIAKKKSITMFMQAYKF